MAEAEPTVKVDVTEHPTAVVAVTVYVCGALNGTVVVGLPTALLTMAAGSHT